MSIIVLLALVVMISSSVLAIDPPKITVAPAWRPAVTLDSIDLGVVNVFDVGDDFRYVDAEIYVTTSVQFWTAQLTCTVAPTALTSYDSAATDGDPGNTVEPVIWGPRWGTLGNDYAQVSDPYIAATGTRTITATRLGNIYPMGSNGYNDTFLLATVRYRAKDLAVTTVSPLTCVSSFLNRNGASVLVATYVAPAPLSVLTGYAINGTATYQARITHAGINVACDGPDIDTAPDFSILTTATGAFANTALRNQGFFDCYFYGNITNPLVGYQPDKYLAAHTWFNLSGQSYSILPITLAGGNLSQNDGSTDTNPSTTDEVIDGNDIGIITAPANWSKLVTAGDINGDGKTDRADLAITAANFYTYELVDSRHAIYSLARNYDYWQNSRIWIGAPWAGAVTQLVPSPPPDGRDSWATLSPNGKQVVFSRQSPNQNIALFVAPITSGIVGVPVRVTPLDAWYDALAPSWSPDGTRIAFICGWWDDGSPGTINNDNIASGRLVDQGDLCIIDATGRNWFNFTGGNGPAKSRIYPPAWLSNSELVYGGSWVIPGISDINPICPNTLCYYNLQTSESRVFDPDMMTGGVGTLKIADMPVISRGALYYRFYDDNNELIQPFQKRDDSASWLKTLPQENNHEHYPNQYNRNTI